jgi:hypothetical protein
MLMTADTGRDTEPRRTRGATKLSRKPCVHASIHAGSGAGDPRCGRSTECRMAAASRRTGILQRCAEAGDGAYCIGLVEWPRYGRGVKWLTTRAATRWWATQARNLFKKHVSPRVSEPITARVKRLGDCFYTGMETDSDQ